MKIYERYFCLVKEDSGGRGRDGRWIRYVEGDIELMREFVEVSLVVYLEGVLTVGVV